MYEKEKSRIRSRYVSLDDVLKPKKLVSQKIKINGLQLVVARPASSKKIPPKFKSLF